MTKVLDDPDLSVRFAALFALEKMARRAIALPTLAALTQDSTLRTIVYTTLAKLGASTPYLVDLFKSKNPDQRLSAAWLWARSGPQPRRRFRCWWQGSRNRRPLFRHAWPCPNWRGRRAGAVVAALATKDAEFRTEVASLLGELGPEAREAAPKLVGLLKDTRPKVRLAAAVALARLDPKTKDLAPVFTAGFAAKDQHTRLLAAFGAPLVKVNGKEALALFEQGLRAQDPNERLITVSMLGQLGPEDQQAVPLLAQALKDVDMAVRQQAATWRASAARRRSRPPWH